MRPCTPRLYGGLGDALTGRSGALFPFQGASVRAERGRQCQGWPRGERPGALWRVYPPSRYPRRMTPACAHCHVLASVLAVDGVMSEAERDQLERTMERL